MNKGRKTQDPLPQMLTGGGIYINIYIHQKIALGVRLFSQNRTVYLLIPCSSATLCFVDFNAVEGASLLDTNINRVKTVIVEGVRM